MADQGQSGFTPINSSSALPSELAQAWVPQDWRESYLETVTNLREVRTNIATLKRNDPCPEPLVNPHPAPPVKFICGTPYLSEIEDDEHEDWLHEKGKISDYEYDAILKKRAEREDVRARARKRDEESRRVQFPDWFSFEEKIKERDALRKQWNSRKSTLPTLKTRLEELELKLKKFTNPQRLSEFKRAYEARTSPEVSKHFVLRDF